MCRTVWAVLLLLAGLAGCHHRAPARPVDTGATHALRAYFDGLVRRDWQQAYVTLDPDSRKRCPQDQFARLAQAYYRNLGFEPTEVHIGSCEEKGAEAISHVVLTGRDSSHSRRYKDGVTLRRTNDGWRVVLPPNFGHKG